MIATIKANLDDFRDVCDRGEVDIIKAAAATPIVTALASVFGYLISLRKTGAYDEPNCCTLYDAGLVIVKILAVAPSLLKQLDRKTVRALQTVALKTLLTEGDICSARVR